MIVSGEQFDMVDQAAVFATNALVLQRLLNGVGVSGKGIKVVASHPQPVIGDQGKTKLPPQAISPVTWPMPGTCTCSALR